MPVKLSKAGKMPCKSWSLEAGSTCPGSIDPLTKKPVTLCSQCYAKQGMYNMPNSKSTRDFNRTDWKRADWVDDMVKALKGQAYFRWFDSGDVYHPALAWKIYEVINKTPFTMHWLPTKSYKIDKIRTVLESIKALPNASVRYSSDSADGEYTPGLHGSTAINYADDKTEASVCPAYSNDGKCGSCRNCWNTLIPVIAYPLHSQKSKAYLRRKGA